MKSSTSWPSSSRKYSATVRPVSATRARAPDEGTQQRQKGERGCGKRCWATVRPASATALTLPQRAPKEPSGAVENRKCALQTLLSAAAAAAGTAALALPWHCLLLTRGLVHLAVHQRHLGLSLLVAQLDDACSRGGRGHASARRGWGWRGGSRARAGSPAGRRERSSVWEPGGGRCTAALASSRGASVLYSPVQVYTQVKRAGFTLTTLNHLAVQIVTLTGALAHTSKHGETTCGHTRGRGQREA